MAVEDIDKIDPPDLVPDETYRACIITNTKFGQGPAPSKIEAQLQDIGFVDVQVWDNPDDLPKDWSKDERRDIGTLDQAQYWARGKWSGEKETDIPTSGENWTLAWMQQEGSEKKFEQSVPTSPYAWIPTVAMLAVGAAAVWIFAKSSKE